MDSGELARSNTKKIAKFKKLNIMSINVNSLVANVRRYNLLHTLEKLQIDVALINENKLKNNHKYFSKNIT